MVDSETYAIIREASYSIGLFAISMIAASVFSISFMFSAFNFMAKRKRQTGKGKQNGK